ncbi:MAG: CPBP family intramembrane metalloprotease [Planctomycetota bacterium]|nr:MAG: CPBP family intramembrane metalloprotease [Planctomycetota bacterium]
MRPKTTLPQSEWVPVYAFAWVLLWIFPSGFWIWATLVPLVLAKQGRFPWTDLSGRFDFRRSLSGFLLASGFTWIPACLLGLLFDFWHFRWPPLSVFWGLAFGAVVEEWFFRGYLQSRLRKTWVERPFILGGAAGPAIAWNAILFALAHVPTAGISGSWFLVFPGLALAWCRSRCGNLFPGIVLHLVFNLWLLGLTD